MIRHYFKIIDKLDEYIDNENKSELKVLVNWINIFFLKFALKEIVNFADDNLPNLTEVKSMFATTFEKILDEKEEKGIEKGVLQTAKLMKDGGISIDQIKQFTGLNDNQIKTF